MSACELKHQIRAVRIRAGFEPHLQDIAEDVERFDLMSHSA